MDSAAYDVTNWDKVRPPQRPVGWPGKADHAVANDWVMLIEINR